MYPQVASLFIPLLIEFAPSEIHPFIVLPFPHDEYSPKDLSEPPEQLKPQDSTFSKLLGRPL